MISERFLERIIFSEKRYLSVKYIASISYGKDSLAMLDVIMSNGLPLDDVIYVEVMATKTLSAELPDMVKFIEYADKRLYDLYGITVTKLRSDLTFEDVFYKVKGSRSKFPGTIYGFPMTCQFAWCNDRLKQRAFNAYFKSIGDDHKRYIGLAADETKRLKRMQPYANAIAPLAEHGITEAMTHEINERNNLTNPLYEIFDRLGCWFCPKQSIKSLAKVRELYPELWAKMLEWDKESPVKFSPQYTLADIEKRLS